MCVCVCVHAHSCASMSFCSVPVLSNQYESKKKTKTKTKTNNNNNKTKIMHTDSLSNTHTFAVYCCSTLTNISSKACIQHIKVSISLIKYIRNISFHSTSFSISTKQAIFKHLFQRDLKEPSFHTCITLMQTVHCSSPLETTIKFLLR